MKNTKKMLVLLSVYLVTWLSLSLLIWLLSTDISFKAVAGHPIMVVSMICLGWIPCMIVESDLK